MPTDTVQIGSLVISKPLFDVLAPLISGLIGILAGGLITYLTTRAIESRKWQRETSYKLQEDRRKAIIIALEWIAPLQQALSKASTISSALQFGRTDEDRFFKDYPNIISSLAKMDPPAHLRVILPEDAYPMSWEIIDGLEELKYLSLEGMSSFKACSDLEANLRTRVKQFEGYLAEEYRGTFS